MTNETRVEVAERMRGPFDVCECMGHTFINGTLYGMQVCARDELALRDGMRHLADLIDPVCKVVPFDEESMRLPHCSVCMQPILKPWPNFCPKCGARITGGGDA